VAVPSPEGPTAAFAWSPQYPATGKPVSFTDQSSGDPTQWEWNFGDGSAVSSLRNATHMFAGVGDYTVTLTVRNIGGSSAKSSHLTVGDPPSAVSFGLDTPSPRAGTQVRLSGSATGAVDTWLWDFGDRTTSVGNPVDHTFTQAGEVIVVVTARNRFGDTAASARLNVANAVVPLAVGDRVAANVDLAGNNSSIRRGDSGTLVCLEKTAGHDAFVNWDHPVEHGYAGFAPCAGTAYDGFGWGVWTWQLERSNSPKPSPPVCVPGKQEIRNCTFSAECSGIQTRVCNGDGQGWSEWGECGVFSVCITDLPAISSSKDGAFTLWKLDREKGVPIPTPVPYAYHAEVKATLGKRYDPTTKSDVIILRRLDQLMTAKPQTGPQGDICKAHIGITTELYDSDRYVATVIIANKGSYLVPDGTTVFGGWTDTSFSVAKPNIKVKLVVTPDSNSGYQPACDTTWGYSWQIPLY
jgi:PKD repeat protein